MALKHDLTRKVYPLKQRLRLFSSVITPTVLYGCAAWTVSSADEGLLIRTERRMLRMILGVRRRVRNRCQDGTAELEPWVQWIKRASAEAKQRVTELGMTNWVQQFRRQKWRWAGELVRGDTSKWSYIAMDWAAEHENGARRDAGRPQKRWDDFMVSITRHHCGTSDWKLIAADERLWTTLESTIF